MNRRGTIELMTEPMVQGSVFSIHRWLTKDLYDADVIAPSPSFSRSVRKISLLRANTVENLIRTKQVFRSSENDNPFRLPIAVCLLLIVPRKSRPDGERGDRQIAGNPGH